MSSIWNYFEKVPGVLVAECLLCKKEYSYKTSITNLKKHLSSKHLSACQNLLNDGEFTANAPPSPTSVQVEIIVPADQTSPVTTTDTQEIESGSLQLERSSRPLISRRNRRIDQQQKKLLDKKLVQMITLDYQPFSIVEDTGFKNFVKALNRNYELPDRKLISGTLVPSLYVACKAEVATLMQNVKRVCITTDSWTSLTMDSYLSVVAHFMIDYELKSVLLHCEHFSDSHTSESSLARALETVAQEWQISDKITLAVSDNTQNISNAIKEVGWPFFGCFLDKLNLVVEKALDVINFLVDKVKRIVAHFKKSHNATESLIKYQTDFEKKSIALQLIQSVPTRWNSVFYMLQRFIQLQGALLAVIPNLAADLPVISTEMWDTMRQVCLILQPFEEATRLMSDTRYLTASLAIVIVDGLKNVIQLAKNKPAFNVTQSFLDKLERGLNSYFPSHEIENSLMLGICTFLDPRFKVHAFLDQTSEVSTLEMTHRTQRVDTIKQEILDNLINKINKKKMNTTQEFATITQTVSNQSTSSDLGDSMTPLTLWRKINTNIAAVTPPVDNVIERARWELEMFLSEEVAARDSCPLKWWQSHECVYPYLAEIFKEISHIVVSSVECGRVFSKAGNVIAAKRARLSRKRTAELVFLNYNSEYCK
ncbi:unnamed protein product [Arctia plantaginis]|uniref:BED-type domain-containing protein n=1 Tax=Arctia plantaginis TaxID=874455 RepID=A0A8S0ZD11_ARCPL|nr:unnamed protein product [Arctia plantaginis]CAB3249796.1 unnamed protein product [Arctia plantaginis]